MSGRPALPRPGLWLLLTALLAAADLWVAGTAAAGAVRWSALAGGLLVLAALTPAVRSRKVALAALGAGAVLPSVIGWWSVVLPVVGCLVLLCGVRAVIGGAPAAGSEGSAGSAHPLDLPHQY